VSLLSLVQEKEGLMGRCVRASLFGTFGQLDGIAGVVKGTDEVKIEYSRSADGLSWTQ